MKCQNTFQVLKASEEKERGDEDIWRDVKDAFKGAADWTIKRRCRIR